MRFLFRRSQRLTGHLALLAAVTALASACSDSDPPKDGDASPPPPDVAGMGDARAEDSSVKGDADAPPSVDDGGCVCTSSDAEFPSTGSMPLSCFCAVPDRCPTFDDASRCSRPLSGYLVIETYTDCNFVSVRLEGGFVSNRRTYDVATHELVGAANFSDVNELLCGASRVFGLQAGVDPIAAGCLVARREVPCPDGGAEPPPDADQPDADASSDADAGSPVPDADAGPPVPDADASPDRGDGGDGGDGATDGEAGYAPEVWDG